MKRNNDENEDDKYVGMVLNNSNQPIPNIVTNNSIDILGSDNNNQQNKDDDEKDGFKETKGNNVNELEMVNQNEMVE